MEMIEECSINVKNLAVFDTETKVKRLDQSVTIEGRTVKSIKYQKAVNYVDTKTGEIISANQARRLGVVEVFQGISCKQREEILNSLRPEIREIAVFVLKFRNKRRGITPSLDEVLRFYALIKDKRVDNVCRHRNKLYDTIMHSSTMCKPLFQFTGKKTTTKEHSEEEAESHNLIFRILNGRFY